MDKESLAKKIVATLHRAGHEALFAGGCVRDRLRGVTPKDFDIATSATPEIITQLFPKTIPVGVQFGVMIVVEEGLPFEVATFRTEGGYQDGRHPTQVAFSNVQEDAKRRDFTVNGLYFDLKTGKVLDYVGGEKDLQAKLIRTIGDPEARFLEDYLRMLRATRFAVQLGFEIDPTTEAVIKKHAELIQKVSQERIRDEVAKSLTSAQPTRAIQLMQRMGILKFVLPEHAALSGAARLAATAHPPIELAMACLLLDVGAAAARGLLKQLTFPNDVIRVVLALIEEHPRFSEVTKMKVSTLKRFFMLERFDLHLELARLAGGRDEACEFVRVKLAEFAKEPAPDLRILTGGDLIAMGYTPGPRFAEILRAVEDEILEGRLSERGAAEAFVKTRFAKEPG